MGDLTVIRVETSREKRQFIEFPKRLYADTAEWVPPFDMDIRNYLKRKHPYFEDTPADFLACSMVVSKARA